MTAPVPAACDKVLLVQAELDGELSAADAAALATHRADCPICQAAATELARARGLVAGHAETMPDEVRRRIVRSLLAAAPRRAQPGLRDLWRWAAGFGLGGACAAAVALFVLSPLLGTSFADQVLAGHIRALQPGHLEDVASSDRHTVKPWFDGRLDFTPPVRELTAQQFPLRGGRLDYLVDRPVAALVYQRDKHIIDLFIWPTEAGAAVPETMQRRGYNLVHWAQNGMEFWAVSDVEVSQLRAFVDAFREAS